MTPGLAPPASVFLSPPAPNPSGCFFMPSAVPAVPLPPTAQLQRVRWSLVTMFGLFGIIVTSWLGRLPSVREALGVSAGQLGVFLVVGAVGSLVGITLIGTVIVRHGSATALRLGMAGALAGFSLIGAGTLLGSIPLFVGGILLNGLFAPATNVSINLEAARVEQLLGKAILPTCTQRSPSAPSSAAASPP